MEKITCAKLSKLQKLVLVALIEPRYAIMNRREFARTIKRLYWGKDSRATTSSLSLALRRLEEGRHYIMRTQGRWQLTDTGIGENGVMLAVLAWAQRPRFYTLLGFQGPPPEMFARTSSPPEDGPGVIVNFDL